MTDTTKRFRCPHPSLSGRIVTLSYCKKCIYRKDAICPLNKADLFEHLTTRNALSSASLEKQFDALIQANSKVRYQLAEIVDHLRALQNTRPSLSQIIRNDRRKKKRSKQRIFRETKKGIVLIQQKSLRKKEKKILKVFEETLKCELETIRKIAPYIIPFLSYSGLIEKWVRVKTEEIDNGNATNPVREKMKRTLIFYSEMEKAKISFISFQIASEGLKEKYSASQPRTPGEAKKEIYALIHETYKLIKRHLQVSDKEAQALVADFLNANGIEPIRNAGKGKHTLRTIAYAVEKAENGR